MDARLIAASIPIFFLLIAIERIASRRWEDPAYRLYDSIADLSCGIGQQVFQVFLYVVELAAFSWVYTHCRVHTFSAHSVASWVLLVLLVDLAYYAFHRASHRVNFLWAVHGVHHQSEEYNLSVALRQGWLEPLVIAPFHAPIALLGFPPEMFFVVFTLHTLWQFWPHTRGIGKLPIDGFMNSPANHRGHHAINPVYIDTNYSGLLIVWDRLFGTWAREGEEPAYGTVRPLRSFNPLWANVSYWTEIAALMRACPRLLDKISVPFRPPEWRPAELGGPVAIPPASRSAQQRYAVQPSNAVRAYAVASFAVVTLALPALTQAPPGTDWWAKLALSILVLLWIVTVAGLVEAKRWAGSLEWLRLSATPGVVWVFVQGRSYSLVAFGASVVLSAAQGVALRWVTLRR
jgi:sterol desaturase/sphingolipid hydroxylase (fatty acid hydroxylase superfamily)